MVGAAEMEPHSTRGPGSIRTSGTAYTFIVKCLSSHIPKTHGLVNKLATISCHWCVHGGVETGFELRVVDRDIWRIKQDVMMVAHVIPLRLPSFLND